MKIVGFQADNEARLGVVEGDNVVDLQAVDAKAPADLGEALRRANGDLGALADLARRAPASAHRPLAGLKYALPVARPGKIICLGLIYLDHVKEGPQRENVPKFQSIFFRSCRRWCHVSAVAAAAKVIQYDYEGEMVVVIGKRAKHLTLENAAERRRLLLRHGKVDPRISTPHHAMEHGREFRPDRKRRSLDRHSGRIAARRQGPRHHEPAQRQDHASSNTDHFMFPVAKSLVYLTEGMTLEPGDLLFTGTPLGGGRARKPEPVWMKAGDTIEEEVEGIGILRNPIEDEKN